MSYRYGKKSAANLAECHPDLQRLFNEAIKYRDISIVDGARSVAEQVKNVQKGVSKTMNSKHLPQADGLSHAVDATPYPFDWNSPYAERDLLLFGGFILGLASSLGIVIRYGGDWNKNWTVADQGFNDLDHFELHP